MKTLTLVLFVLTLSACAPIEIRDTLWYLNLRTEAVGFHTLTEQRQYLNSDEWYDKQLGMLCTSPENFAYWKSLVLKLCEETECTYSVEETARNLGAAAKEGVEIRKNAGLTHP